MFDSTVQSHFGKELALIIAILISKYYVNG